VYFIGGAICAFLWLGATSIQIYTSEEWLLGVRAGNALSPHFSVLAQITTFWTGQLTTDQLVSYTFAWCVQAALLACSIGMELPRHTPAARRRANICTFMCVVMVTINSLGDFAYDDHLGVWGHAGFTGAVFFGTFFLGIVATWLFMTGIRLSRGTSN
jgi:hypothetical protein